jgi:ADP-ribose pyrophosphatase YjhB (NUDIX family)
MKMARIDHYHVEGAPKATHIVPAVSAVVRDANGLLVLQRRTDNQLWALPGGGLEPGESVVNALRREIHEETGYDVEIGRLVGIYSDPDYVIEYSDGEVRQEFSICFAAKVIGGSRTVSSESLEVSSFSDEDITKLEIHPAIRKRIDDYLSDASAPYVS